jgi:hypothetical protein
MCNERILILCEGPTVRSYAQALISEMPRAIRRVVSVEVFFQQKPDPKKLIAEARRLERRGAAERNPYTAVWLFFEAGEITTLQEALASIEGSIYRAAYAYPCIESWYALHFDQLDKPYTDLTVAMQELSRFWPEYRRIGFNPLPKLRDTLTDALLRARKLNDLMPLDQATGSYPMYVTVPDLINYLEELKQRYG